MDNLARKVTVAKTRWDSICGQVRRLNIAVVEAEDQLEATEEAQFILQFVGQHIQEQVHQQIAGVVSRCLEAVFDEPYEFEIRFEKKRNRTEARLVFVRDGVEFNPMDAAGGGVIDVAAFALRLACLMLRRPPARRVLILDEPFRFVSATYRPAIKQLLETLAEELNMQFIMVTHIPELVIGRVIELG